MVRAGLDPDQTINNQSSVAPAESGLAIEYIGPAAKQQTKSSGCKKVMADRTFFFFVCLSISLTLKKLNCHDACGVSRQVI